jgi:hypothetical protein
MASFLQFSPTKMLYTFCSLPYVLHVPDIASFLIVSIPMVRGMECKVWSFRAQFVQPPLIILFGVAVLTLSSV